MPTPKSEAVTLIYTTHRENVPTMLRDRGVLCPDARGPGYREIWSCEIVERRAKQVVNPASNLTLGRCVGLTVTTKTPAHFAVATGYGVPRVPNCELVHLETDVVTLMDHLIGVAIADRNPLARDARIIAGSGGLAHVDWELIASGKFSKTPDDPTRVTRAGAEALIKNLLPLSAVRRIVCWNAAVAQTVERLFNDAGVRISVEVRPEAFFGAGA